MMWDISVPTRGTGCGFMCCHGSYRTIQEAGDAIESLRDPVDEMKIRRFGVLQKERCEPVDNLPIEELLKLAGHCDEAALSQQGG